MKFRVYRGLVASDCHEEGRSIRELEYRLDFALAVSVGVTNDCSSAVIFQSTCAKEA